MEERGKRKQTVEAAAALEVWGRLASVWEELWIREQSGVTGPSQRRV